jgi:hypothetical protein
MQAHYLSRVVKIPYFQQVAMTAPAHEISGVDSGWVQNSTLGIAMLFRPVELAIGWRMKIPGTMLRLKGFRHPREIIAYAVWA